jgi:hypothetical protein
MKRMVAEDGNNAWLADGTPHCDVRKDFYDTDTGIQPHTKREQSQLYLYYRSRPMNILILHYSKWSFILDPAFPTTK